MKKKKLKLEGWLVEYYEFSFRYDIEGNENKPETIHKREKNTD